MVLNPCKTAANAFNRAIAPINAGGKAMGSGLGSMVDALARVADPLMSKVELGVGKIKSGVTQIVDDLLAIFAAVQEVFNILNEVVGGNILGIAKMMLIVRIQSALPGISMVEAVIYATAALVVCLLSVYCSPLVACSLFCGPLNSLVFDTDAWDDELLPPDAAQVALLLCVGATAAAVRCLQAAALLPQTPGRNRVRDVLLDRVVSFRVAKP